MYSSFYNAVPIEFEQNLAHVRAHATAHNLTSQQQTANETNLWIAQLASLWSGCNITLPQVHKLNARQIPFKFMVVALVNQATPTKAPTTLLRGIGSQNQAAFTDGSVLKFARETAGVLWARLQKLRTQSILKTSFGVALKKATDDLRTTLNEAYRASNHTCDDRVYPTVKINDDTCEHSYIDWKEDLRNELSKHARHFSYFSFDIVPRPSDKIDVRQSFIEAEHNCTELTRILVRANTELKASLAYWREHYEGTDAPRTHAANEEDEAYEVEEDAYDAYEIPFLEGKYAGKLRTH